jgi:hypothetical protein
MESEKMSKHKLQELLNFMSDEEVENVYKYAQFITRDNEKFQIYNLIQKLDERQLRLVLEKLKELGIK